MEADFSIHTMTPPKYWFKKFHIAPLQKVPMLWMELFHKYYKKARSDAPYIDLMRIAVRFKKDNLDTSYMLPQQLD